jgi:hypothetical protein
MDPDMAIKFLDSLNHKITTLSYKRKPESSFQEIRSDVAQLSATVEEISSDAD